MVLQDDFPPQLIATRAIEMDSAIVAILHGTDNSFRQEANKWLTSFCENPEAWTVALHVAFPPPNDSVGRNPDVRFFALNVLLGKVRQDAIQLAEDDVAEVYGVLLRQLAESPRGPVRSRLCVLVAAMATLAGPDACIELVEESKRTNDFSMAVELLTAMAEEAVLRARALPWEIGECMQDCCSHVVYLIERHLATGISSDQIAQSFVCIGRWQHAGITLTELYSQHKVLYKALIMALGKSQPKGVQEASVELLAELIAEVDLLPGRNEAVRETITGLLEAVGPEGPGSHGCEVFLPLLTTLGKSEAHLLALGGTASMEIIKFLLYFTSSPSQGRGTEMTDRPEGGVEGGIYGGGLYGAAMAAEVWPKISAVRRDRRGREFQSNDLFVSVMKAVMESSCHVTDSDEDEEEYEDFERYREGPFSEALVSCYKELGSSFLESISAGLWE